MKLIFENFNLTCNGRKSLIDRINTGILLIFVATETYEFDNRVTCGAFYSDHQKEERIYQSIEY